MIAIVCGGRDYGVAPAGIPPSGMTEAEFLAACDEADRQRARLNLVLDAAVERMGLATVIEGAARGADDLAKQWAIARGDVSVIDVPANWSAGKSAGAARNQLMLTMMLRSDDDKGVIAFPGGTGTKHMVGCCEGANRTQDARIRIIKVDWK